MTFSRSKSGSGLTRTPRQAWVLEPRMMFDAAAVVTAVDVAAAVAATDTAPGVDATPVKATVTITDSSDSFQPVDLFSDVRVSADKNGQELKDLVITVNRTGANQALVIDGTEITLESGNGAKTTAGAGQYSYTVAVSGATTTVTVSIASSEAFEPNDVAKLIDGIAYKPLDNTVAGGDVVVTLKSLSDEGGTSTDTADLNIHATVTIDSKINVAPVVSGETLLEAESLTTGTDVAYSADGKQAYIAGLDNTLTIFTVGESGHLTQKQSLTVENLGHVNHMVVSADGKSLYTISSNGNLMQFSLQNGTPSHTATISVGAGSNGGLAIADDGSQIYVDASSSYGREVFVYQRNTETGELTRTDSLRHRNGVIATAGEYVYIAHSGAIINDNHELQVYQRDSAGKLTLLGSISLEIKGQDPVDYAMAASIDGKSVYIANPKTNDITLYRVGSDNALTLVNTFSTPPVGSLVLNAEGTRLYAAATDGMVSAYAVSSAGALTLVGQAAGSTTGGDLALSQDGRSLLVAGEGVSRYSTLLTQISGSDATIASGITLSDANFDALNAGNGNYGDMQLIVSRDGSASDKDIFNFSNTNDLRLENEQILQGDRAIATFSQSGGILTIAFLPGTSRAEANAVLHQVTYQNTDTVAGGSVVTLSLRANDGKVDSLPVTLAVLVTTNTAPILTVEAAPLSNYDTTATVVKVFTNTQITAGEAGKKILDVRLNIGGLKDAANEFLVIDGARIDLTQSNSGKTASGYTYTYTLNDGSGTLEIHHATGMTMAAAQALINDVAYTNETTQATAGIRTVTLVSLRDDGGVAEQGVDTASLNVTATLTLAINNAPTIQTDIPVDPNLYYSDGLLTGYDSHVSSIVLSDDGRTLLVIGTTAANYGGDARVSLYQRDPDTGKLTLLQRLVPGTDDGDASNGTEVSGLIGRAAVFSDDGSTVYLSANSEVLVFSKDANTGMLSLTARVDGLAGNVLKLARSDDGKSLYALTAGTLYHYTIGDSGTLSNSATFTQVDGTTPIGLSVDASGTVYVLGNSGKITIYTTAANGAVSYAGQLARGSDGVTLTYTDSEGNQKSAGTLATSNELNHANSAFTVTDEGYIYVVTSNVGNRLTVLHYDSSTNAVSRVEALTFSNPWGVTASADGKTLYVGSNNGAVTVYAIGSDGKLTQTGTLAAGRPVTTLTLSEDGKSLYTGARFFNTGVMISSAAAHATYSQTAEMPFATSVTLSDQDLDAADDYKGVTITVSRNGDASANDRFAFQSGGDLTLSGSEIQYQGATIATFSGSEGALTIVFTESVTKAVVNQVLHQVTYRNEGDTAGAAISLKIGFSDGSKDTSLLLMMVPNKAPVVDNVEYTPPSATAGQHYEQTLPDDLFRGPENGAMTWQVNGLPAGLTFDPETRTISGTPAINGAGTFAITVVVSGESGAQAEQTLTLSIASDPAQVPSIGGESSALQSIGTLDGYDSNSYVDVLNGVKDSELSSDGKTLYVVSSPESGSAVLSVFVRDAEGTFTLSKTFFNYRSVYNEETEQNDKIVDHAGLAGASDVTLSADGQYLYVVGSEGNAVTIFRVSSDGELTQADVLDSAALGGHSLDVRSHIVSQGDYLYLTAAQSGSDNDSRSVLVFKRGTDGTLAAVSQADNLIGASRLVLDPDGRYLFVSGSGDTVGVTGFRIDAEGKLTQVSQIRAEGDDLYYINSLALSPDGKTLYAINADGIQYTLNTITVGADGALSLTGTTSITDDGGDTGEGLATGLVVSADGTALFVIGKNITVFSRAEDGSLTLKDTISGSWDGPINLFFSDLQQVELSANGKQLYLIGGDKVHVLNVGTAGATYTEGNDATVLLPSGRLSDPQLDALNSGVGNYNGASITVSRQEGGRPEDTFGLKADNGLTLDGDNILKGDVAIATFTQVDGVLTVTFTASVTQADAQNVLRQITYQNTSPDPEQAGSSPAFTFSMNDGDNNTTSMDITVNLIGVNDPSTLTTTVLNPQIPGNGEFVKLFKDTYVDTIESGQTIWQVVLTFDVSGPNETISVDGSTIVLEKSNGTPRTASGLQYSVDVKDGKATVLLYVGRDASGTAAIIDSIGYNYLGSNPSGERHVTLMIKENNYNGSAPETTLDQAITLTLVPAAEPNTAPVITVPGTTPTYTERADPIVLAPDATVSDAQMDKLNGGKGNYDGATLKITLGDGKTALDKLGFSAENGLTLSGNALQKDGVTIGQVSNQDGVLTIRFNANAGTIPTTEDVQNTLRQITYASDSRTPAAQVAVTVMLSDRYLESQVMTLSVAITAINDTPVVANDPVLSADELRLVNTYTAISGLGTVTAAAHTTDGLALYVSDDKGAIALFQRDANSGELTYVRTFAAAEGVTGISQLQVSAEGNSVYALRADGNAIVWFSRDANGELTHKATIASDYNIDNGNLNNIKGIALSDDGKNLYLINSYSDQLAYFSRDTATGALTYVEALGGDMNNPPYLWAPTSILSRGNLLFVTTAINDTSAVIVYQRDDSGKLTPLGHVRDFTDAAGNTIALSGLDQLTVSADGRSIFVASAGQIDAFTLDTVTGTFTHIARVAAEGTVSDIALSADARVLYVTQSDGALTRYVLNGQTLTKLDTLKNADTGFAHLLPVDGGLITLGNGVSVLDEVSRLPVYRVDGPAIIVAPSIVLSDAELDALNGGAGNYQGASITLQRGETASAGDRFDFTAGNGFTLANGVISKDGQAVATFTQADGKLTVTFTAAISRSDATALARQISWATSAPLTGDSASLTLVLNDGAADSAAQALGVTLSREVNLPPVGHADQFTPPTAQAGTHWSYTLPGTLFTDPENNALTFTVDDVQLPEGVRFDSATRTFSGTPSAAGLFNLTITATDSAGNATAMNVALTVNAASTPVDPGTPDPGTPTEPVNPDNTATAAPVILVQQGASLPVDSSEREREQPLETIVADLSRPEAQPLPNNIVTEPVRQRDANTARQSDAPWVLDPVMSSLMPTLEQVNFSSRAEASTRDNAALRPADSNLFLSVRGQTTALESAFSSVQGALQPDASGVLAFSLPQRMFSVREGNATLTLQLANGRPLPAWVQFDARNGVVRITDASAVQVNQIQLALKAQAADGTSRIVPITLQTGQGNGAERATDRGAMQLPVHSDALPVESRDAERLAPAGKTAFTEQLRQHQPEQDALLAALSELSSLRA
ncbi:beta-propeller fold lactonase family protein [Pectobacterium brasiliense]|uniref:beta-propeller fold lactonase family protein n=1 Tax=Pectobacterium brasiliense TaxID=180957 RepID=UPI001CE185DA|nr:beta-propeller fold lactonase family protein [Pectobacterium brasiliense]MCA5919940.1 beta-propeller fold lactonase family protein [Pectobacterium brasiliense]MCA5926671.1 beta-propeller fold lactonase family protein [Pectobacterium brasiliense]MCA5935057.1 beta-propeller fold lactonase family protein [Pectobacterium brasiliense]MCA5938614.1 beta-propeller fold lactonase family protein [Pectobacterium brasiliense]MCA5942906.1 beta-propeller fold lactonase family protein [Pectobacterium bras